MPTTRPRLPPVPPRPPSLARSESRSPRSIWVWIAVSAAIALVALVLWTSVSTTDEEDVTYADLLEQVRADGVSSVELHLDSGVIDATRPDGSTFTVQGPPGGIPDADVSLFDEHEVERNYAADTSNWVGSLVVFLVPVLLIVGVLVWMGRRTQRQLGGMTAFRQSRARVHGGERPKTAMTDIAGYDAVKQEIGEVVGFLREPEPFRQVGARIPKGLLLVGPPGTGKTLFAKAIAGEAHVPFISITGSEFLEMFVGVGAARVRDLFETARRQRPCIVFVDEIDAIGRKRGTGLGGGHDEREQALNQLLAEMDGFESTEGIVVLAATNRPDILDPALLRSCAPVASTARS